ncbi:DUF924 family protein [Pseudomonadota bacterium]
MTTGYQDIIDFWFSERVRKMWWGKDEAFDEEIRTRFADVHQKAAANELIVWRQTPAGRLAEVIVLDQFPRNMFRDQAAAFATDERARQCTREAVAAGADQALPAQQRAFLYMPLMHSESAADHEEAVSLFSSDPGLKNILDFELKHKAIIDRFGRYPHRNKVLGRTSTPEEEAFLQQPDSSF